MHDHVPRKGACFVTILKSEKNVFGQKIVKQKSEKNVPGKTIMKKIVEKNVPGKNNSEKNGNKKYLEKNGETNSLKSVPGKK